MNVIAEPTVRLKGHSIAIGSAVVFTVALLARLCHYRQSLWCDEMSTLLDYIVAPWRTIVAAGAGQYVPNDHVFFTLLAKVCLGVGGASMQSAEMAHLAALIRFPSLLAGSITPVAMAWPLRYRMPLLAMIVALLAALNPWLVAFSDEARGYSLMILLGILATNLLPDARHRWPVAYAIVVAAMLYTVPVAGMLLVAHGIAVVIFRRKACLPWLRGACLGGGIAMLLYLPMYRGISFYYQHPLRTPDNYADFLNQLPRFAAAGQYAPTLIDPLTNIHDPFEGILVLLVSVGVLVAGSFASARDLALKQPLFVMATATILFLVVAFFFPGAGQVRLVPWCAIWLIFAVASIASWVRVRWGLSAMSVMVVIAAGWFAYSDVVLLPSQPIREAIYQADTRVAAPSQVIVVAFLTATESVRIYHDRAIQHRILAAPTPGEFLDAEKHVIKQTGQRPCLIISYEYLVHDFSPRVWDYVQANYHLRSRLPGRISPVSIYVPR